MYIEDGTDWNDDDKCLLTPFIWTVFVDFACSVVAYTVYKVGTLYVARAGPAEITKSAETTHNSAESGSAYSGAAGGTHDGGQRVFDEY